MTRDQAVERFQRSGFIAYKRDWGLGKTVLVATSTETHGDNITELVNALYLCPLSGGHWYIDDCREPGDDTEYGSLEKVVETAELRLKQKLAAEPGASA